MKILLLEDDHLQADWIVSQLKREFGAAVRALRTELEFRDALTGLAANPPDVAVLDVIVRWTDPAPDMVEPVEEAREGPKRAGVRCARLLLEHCPKLPIILYTVLELTDLQEGDVLPGPDVTCLSKESSPKPLIDRIRTLTEAR